MNVFNFDGYSEFCDWCETNGYDPDEQYNLTEDSCKSDVWQYFYVKQINGDLYAEVSVLVSYNHGWQEGEITRAGLTRKVEQIVTEKVSYA